jgi:2-polyprenyl-3-methyl-5-hydroxy-6-metoxy-1,4-benzoquinol methylase
MHKKKKLIKSCKICKSKQIKFIYKYSKQNYYKCNLCGLVFQNPFPTISFLKKYYNKEYFNKGYSIISKQSRKELYLREIQYKLDKKILTKYFKDSPNKNILDYGCGNGNFLAKFKSKKYGYDFNNDVKFNKSIQKVDFTKKIKFDLIIMRGVIEHILNFDEVVVQLIKKLKKGGFFYITATPNTNNLSFFLSNKSFNQNKDLGHIFHFNNVNLSMFFLKNNLFNIETIFQYPETPYAKFKKDYKHSKIQLKNYLNSKDKKSISPPGVGNMMTLLFKKLD